MSESVPLSDRQKLAYQEFFAQFLKALTEWSGSPLVATDESRILRVLDEHLEVAVTGDRLKTRAQRAMNFFEGLICAIAADRSNPLDVSDMGRARAFFDKQIPADWR